MEKTYSMMVQGKETITTLELLEQINIFREQDGRSKMRHADLLSIIRDEFEEEITQRKISLSEYKDKSGKRNTMFVLTLSQAKQVLVRESKFVRKAVIRYIEELEQQIKSMTPQISKKQQILLTIFDDSASIEEKIGATETLIDISRGEICNSVINLEVVEDLIIETLKDEEIINHMSRLTIREAFHKTLFRLGYITYRQFPTKDGKRLEKVYTKVPTESFNEVFRDSGMAIVRSITGEGDDNRGKVEIKFTKYIVKWLHTEQFKETYLKVASNMVIVPQVDETMVDW